MKTYKNIYQQIYNLSNLVIAWRKARERKTKKYYVLEFEKDLEKNLLFLHKELKNQTYSPKPLETFTLRDPKTRRISKSDFRDRIVHHAIVNVLEPIYEKIFIYDSCASRKNKGTLFALNRFKIFMRKVSKNNKKIKNNFYDKNYITGYCFKADIKHYFQEVDHEILLSIIKKKIADKSLLKLIEKIVANFEMKRERELI